MNQIAVNLIGVVATPSEINELIENDERARLDLLSETADHARADDMPYAQRLQRREIGFVRNLVRRDRMLFAMSRQKCNTPAAQFAYDDRRGWFSVRSLYLDGFDNRESRQFTETRSADNTNERVLRCGECLSALLARGSR